MAKKRGKRVSLRSKDFWEISGNRAGLVRAVDFSTGEIIKTRFILEAAKRQFRVECRRCGKWGVYSLDSLTDDEKNSGLCPVCFRRENPPTHAIGVDSEGKLVSINLQTKQEQSWILSDMEINHMKKLLYDGIDLELVKCPSNPFENAKELLFVDDSSDYGKAIKNKGIQHYIAKFRSFERWKREHPAELLELLSWSEDEVSAKRFKDRFPNVHSSTGKTITTPFLKSIREHCNSSSIKFFQDWEGFEFSIRDALNRWGQLDRRRYLIFKYDSKRFCYREIDALARSSKVNILIDAKWSGGEIEKSQMELYMEFLERIGIPISKGIFVTADDEFDSFGDNIFRFPLEWFQILGDIDKVDLLIDRLSEKHT